MRCAPAGTSCPPTSARPGRRRRCLSHRRSASRAAGTVTIDVEHCKGCELCIPGVPAERARDVDRGQPHGLPLPRAPCRAVHGLRGRACYVCPGFRVRGRPRFETPLAVRRLRARRVQHADRADTVAGLAQALDVARWSMQVLDGLAFAHEAGLAHRDIQAAMVLIDDSGRARLMGLEIAPAPAGHAAHAARTRAQRDRPAGTTSRCRARRAGLRPGAALRAHRTACVGAGRHRDGDGVDAAPGREIVRLPWTTARPIPEALRVIANRATDRQQRHRYHSARTLARALEGWIRAEEAADGGPLALLIDRLRSIGALPSLPGAARRAARLALMERERTIELARDRAAGSGAVLRAAARGEYRRGARRDDRRQRPGARRCGAPSRWLVLDGVRRAALSLRDWPGPLGSGAATQLEATHRARATRRPHRAVAAPARLRRRGGVSGRVAAEPGPPGHLLSLSRRGGADAAADATG